MVDRRDRSGDLHEIRGAVRSLVSEWPPASSSAVSIDRGAADPAQNKSNNNFHSKMSDIQKNLEALQAKRKQEKPSSPQGPKRPQGFLQEMISKPMIAEEAVQAYKAAREKVALTPSASSSAVETPFSKGERDEGGDLMSQDAMSVSILENRLKAENILNSPPTTVPGPSSPASSWKPPRPPSSNSMGLSPSELPGAVAAVEKLRVTEVRLQHTADGLEAARIENAELREQVGSLSSVLTECAELRARVVAMEEVSTAESVLQEELVAHQLESLELQKEVEDWRKRVDEHAEVVKIHAEARAEVQSESRARVESLEAEMFDLREAQARVTCLESEVAELKVKLDNWSQASIAAKKEIETDAESSAVFKRIVDATDDATPESGVLVVMTEILRELRVKNAQLLAESTEMRVKNAQLIAQSTKESDQIQEFTQGAELLAREAEIVALKDALQEEERKHKQTLEQTLQERTQLQKRIEEMEGKATEQVQVNNVLKESASLLQKRLTDAEYAVAEASGCALACEDVLDAAGYAAVKAEERMLHPNARSPQRAELSQPLPSSNGIIFESTSSRVAAVDLQKALEELKSAKEECLDLMPTLRPQEKASPIFDEDDRTRLARHGFIQTNHRSGLWPLDSSWGEELSFGSVDAILPAFGSSEQMAPTKASGDVISESSGPTVPPPSASSATSALSNLCNRPVPISGGSDIASLEDPFKSRNNVSFPLSGLSSGLLSMQEAAKAAKQSQVLENTLVLEAKMSKEFPGNGSDMNASSASYMASTPTRSRPISPQQQSALRPGESKVDSSSSAVSASPQPAWKPVVRQVSGPGKVVTQVVRSSSGPTLGRNDVTVACRQQKSPVRVSLGTSNGTVVPRRLQHSGAILAEPRPGIEALSNQVSRNPATQQAVPPLKLGSGPSNSSEPPREKTIEAESCAQPLPKLSEAADNLDRAMKELAWAKSSTNFNVPSPF